MEKRTGIYFVILTWNSIDYIDACIRSVFACERILPFVHVVDNGSTDGTKEFLRFCESQHQNLKCTFLGTNRGTTIARNVALSDVPSECEYICILDSDTVINDAAMNAMVSALESDNSIGLVGPTMVNLSGEEQLSGRNLPTLGIKLCKVAPISKIRKLGELQEVPSSEIRDGVQNVPYLLSACWVFSKRTLEDVGLLDEKIFYAPEDVDYCVRVWLSGKRVVRYWPARIVHAYQRISKRKFISKMNFLHLKGLVYFFHKYRFLFSSHRIEGFLYDHTKV